MGLISNGTTIFDAGALDSGLAKGAITFIKKLTASSSATLSFVDGASGVVLDNTYKEYVFTFNNMHLATNGQYLSFQVDTGTNTNYNIAVTSTIFKAYHKEDGSASQLGYDTQSDQAQGTAFQRISSDFISDNDSSISGKLTMFSPSSDTFVKHFISRASNYGQGDEAADCFVAGYFNTTSAIDEIQFKVSSGNIDSGTIKLYGIK